MAWAPGHNMSAPFKANFECSSAISAMMAKLHTANADKFCRKLDNLKKKKTMACSMVQVELDDAEALSISEVGGLKLHTPCEDMFKKPFLVVMDAFAWVWDWNSFPLPGVSCVITCLETRVFVKLIPIAHLRSKGLSSLSSLDQFLGSLDDPKAAFSCDENPHSFLNPRELMYVPFGFMPLVFGTGLKGEKEPSKAELLALPLYEAKPDLTMEDQDKKGNLPLHRRWPLEARFDENVEGSSSALEGLVQNGPWLSRLALRSVLRVWEPLDCDSITAHRSTQASIACRCFFLFCSLAADPLMEPRATLGMVGVQGQSGIGHA